MIWSDVIPLNANSLSERKGEPHRGQLARFGLVISLFIALNIAFLKDDSVAAKPTELKINKLKQITFHKLDYSFDEFYCINELWFRESRWNYKAKNPRSSAFGIPQILGLKTKDPIKQIDRGLAYIKHRHLTACNALAFHDRKGWY